MEYIKKFTPCRSTYIILCTIIPIWPILVGIIGIFNSDPTGIWLTIIGVGLIVVIAFVISKYNVVVNELSISCISIFKKTTILRSDITNSKFTFKRTNGKFTPVFYIFTLNSEKPSMKIAIKSFSREDVREMASILGITDCPV